MGLQWQDIDFGGNMISIERERLGAVEKGENVNAIITDDPKTPAGIMNSSPSIPIEMLNLRLIAGIIISIYCGRNPESILALIVCGLSFIWKPPCVVI